MRSLGTRDFSPAENLAREAGFPRARRRPKALRYPPGAERDSETRNLIEWYKRHGYRATADSGFVEWQKEL